MGKKLSSNQASTKISKEDKKKLQHQLNTMIKILRPKVYITRSSDFKRLVQELTGNNGNNNYSPVCSTPPVLQQPPIIEITEAEDYQHHPQENTSPEFSVDLSSDGDTSNNSNNNNNNYVGILSSYDSPSAGGVEIVVPENLYSMLEEVGCLHQNNNMEKDFNPSPPHSTVDLLSLSPPSSSSCDWELEMMDPFITYNNFYDFGDAYIPKEQALCHHQEACVFENIELLQW
ncbi:hypothetical protein LIER_40204 [Lithospermum erythrorhizon]|uniref:VQ domain-containing protein n=1 Tax=Lithospermum erythrorhizon TaxID=34254 RepID=A0AAV3QSK5_LITER